MVREVSNVVQLQLIESAKTAKPARKSRLAKDWQPSEENIAFAASLGITERNIMREAEVFRDYWIGTGKPMADWNAVWRNWMRRHRNDNRYRSTPSSPIM